MLKPIHFALSEKDFNFLRLTYPNMKNNQDIGKYGVQVAKLYLESKGAIEVLIEEKKVDIQAKINGKLEKYEVKSTCDSEIAFGKLKVSSPKDYKSLVEDEMEIIRVCKVGQQTLDIYFLKHGKDFTLTQEPRWRLVKTK
jgi:hypothetical protein